MPVARLVIATRQSPLALWQARFVAGELRRQVPGLEVNLLELSTEGDRFLNASLQQRGGKGLFVKEIEQAVRDGRADLAVHSLKDVTQEISDDLVLAAFPKRENPRDAWVSPTGVAFGALQAGARVGTSSVRRAALLRASVPGIEVVGLRGNVQTRLRKTQELGLSGTMLAAAGLKRLGLAASITETLSPEISLPAIGQGVLAIQCRTADQPLRALLTGLDDPPTRLAVLAERSLLQALEGGCSAPMAGHATVHEKGVHLKAWVGRPDGSHFIRAEAEGPGAEAVQLGQRVADELLRQGAREILRGVS